MKVKCKGGCGDECASNEKPSRGFGAYHSEDMVEWVCDKCWGKGVRTEAYLKYHNKK